MPFEVAEIETGPMKQIRASVRYMRHHSKKSGPKGLPLLLVSVPTAVVISKAEYFQLLVGTVGDVQKLRIKGVKVKAGGVKPTEFHHHLMLRFGHIKQYGEEIFDTTYCPIRRINDDEYEIELPMNPLA
ncbi:MAG: hypothetical protein WBR29_07385 [Gammaproteobacteria bacterium]